MEKESRISVNIHIRKCDYDLARARRVNISETIRGLFRDHMNSGEHGNEKARLLLEIENTKEDHNLITKNLNDKIKRVKELEAQEKEKEAEKEKCAGCGCALGQNRLIIKNGEYKGRYLCGNLNSGCANQWFQDSRKVFLE